MLTPVSSFGTPTITLEMDPQTSLQVYPPSEENKQVGMGASESPITQLELVTGKLASAIRIAKLDPPTVAPPTLLQVVDSSSSGSSTPKNPQVLLSPYSSLLAGAGGMSPHASALHLALLAQSQQMRSLGISSLSSSSISTSQPTSVSTTQPSSSSSVSTVVASPLPPSLSNPQQPAALPATPVPAKRDHTPSSSSSSTTRRENTSSTSSPAKRDNSSSSSSASKRVRTLRRTTSSGD